MDLVLWLPVIFSPAMQKKKKKKKANQFDSVYYDSLTFTFTFVPLPTYVHNYKGAIQVVKSSTKEYGNPTVKKPSVSNEKQSDRFYMN